VLEARALFALRTMRGVSLARVPLEMTLVPGSGVLVRAGSAAPRVSRLASG
jgi:hypothetical protein